MPILRKRVNNREVKRLLWRRLVGEARVISETVFVNLLALSIRRHVMSDSTDNTKDLLSKRRSRRQVLASLGLGAAALYVAPTLLSMGQAEAREHRHSRPSRSRPSYSRPSYSRPHYSRPHYSRPRYSRPDYSRARHSHQHHSRHGHGYPERYYSRPQRSRWERDGVIEIRLSRVLPRW